MINRIKPNTKAANFQRIFFLVTFHEIADALPVLRFERGIVVAVKCRALEASKIRRFQRCDSITSFIKKETNCSCSSIICILNQFLMKYNSLSALSSNPLTPCLHG